MGCAFRLRRVGETVSRFGAIFRVALSATRLIRKPRPTIRPKTGPHFPERSQCNAGTRSVPNCRQERNVPKHRLPNDYSSDGNVTGRGRTASDVQDEQVGMKKARHRPRVMPRLLNDKLSSWAARSVGQLRRLVKRRNELPRNSPSSSWHSSSRWLRNRRQTTRRRHCRNT